VGEIAPWVHPVVQRIKLPVLHPTRFLERKENSASLAYSALKLPDFGYYNIPMANIF